MSKENIAVAIDKFIERYKSSNPSRSIERGRIPVEFISTGNLALNYILSGRFEDGGIPAGQMTEVHGDPMTGKSLLCYSIMDEFLKKYKDGVVILDDVECAFVDYFFSNKHTDMSRVIRLSSSTVEEHASIFIDSPRSKSLISELLPYTERIMVVLDSVAALSTKHEVSIGLDKPDISKAKVVRSLLRVVSPVIKINEITYVMVNHLIFNIGQLFGPKKVTTSGTGVAYQSSVRLCLDIKEKIRGKSEIEGVKVKASVVKNRFFPPYKDCMINIHMDSGIDKFSGLVGVLVNMGILASPVGGRYRLIGSDLNIKSSDIKMVWDRIKEHMSKRKGGDKDVNK